VSEGKALLRLNSNIEIRNKFEYKMTK